MSLLNCHCVVPVNDCGEDPASPTVAFTLPAYGRRWHPE